MLSFCGFMILLMIGFLFVKKENKNKIINLVKGNVGLLGGSLVLLFLIRGMNQPVEGYGQLIEGYGKLIEGYGKSSDEYEEYEEIKRNPSQCGNTL